MELTFPYQINALILEVINVRSKQHTEIQVVSNKKKTHKESSYLKYIALKQNIFWKMIYFLGIILEIWEKTWESREQKEGFPPALVILGYG